MTPRLEEAHKQIAQTRLASENKIWKLFWSPEGRQIDTVRATSASAAIRKALQPYRQYPGEIYAEEV